jgi:hypothetical protein
VGGGYTPYQQSLIDRMGRGGYDYTFGPGSPGATPEDLQTYVGGRYSPAGGFAREGGYALAPQDYYSFTPQQRRELGVMDIAPSNQAGQLERYYGAGGGGTSTSGAGGEGKSFWDYLNPFGGTSRGGSGTGQPTQRGVGMAVGTATNLLAPGLGFVTGPIARWITSKIQGGANPQQVYAQAAQAVQKQSKLPPMPQGSVSLPRYGGGYGSAPGPTGAEARGSEYWSPDFGRALGGPNITGQIGQLGSYGGTGLGAGGSGTVGNLGTAIWSGAGGGSGAGNLGSLGARFGKSSLQSALASPASARQLVSWQQYQGKLPGQNYPSAQEETANWNYWRNMTGGDWRNLPNAAALGAMPLIPDPVQRLGGGNFRRAQ